MQFFYQTHNNFGIILRMLVSSVPWDKTQSTEAWLIQWMNHTELASVASLCTKDILETVDKPAGTIAIL